MTSSDTNELAEDLAKSLNAVTILTQSLLGEIRDNATSLAVLKEKFDTLSENLEVLSKIIRMGNGSRSLLTRVALLEKSIEDIEEEITKVEDSVGKVEGINKNISMNIWKIGAIVLPGIIALALEIIKFLSEISSK